MKLNLVQIYISYGEKQVKKKFFKSKKIKLTKD